MPAKPKQTFFQDFWLNTAQVAEKYGEYYRKKVHSNSGQQAGKPAKADAGSSTGISDTLHSLKVVILRKKADPQLSILVHQLYREVAQDTNLCFQVEKSGVLRLLSFSNLELFSVDSITDIIAIYDFLIVEMAKNFVSTQSTDYDESTEIAISKSIGAFLVNCLKYYSNNFPVKIIESIALFTFHLSNSCLILTHLVDLWFQHCIQDPDIMFLVSSFKSIPADCFPLYELSKDFLFFGDNLINVSRDTLINIIMISGFSQPLRDWILRSEFPKLIITGLFSNFNQIFNSNPFVSNIESNPSFIQFNWYIDFLYDIITFSTHDQIKFVFLSVFESNFLNKVIDYYNHSHNLDSKSNTLFLLLKTFEKLLSTSGAKSNTFTFNFILNELIDSYFKKKKNTNNNSFPLLDIFTDLILSCNQLEFNTHEINSYEVSTISSLKLFNLFATLNSLDLLIELFSDSEYCYTHHNSSSVNSIIQNGSNIFPLTSKFKEIIKVNDNLKFFFFTNLTKSFELLQSNFIKTDRFGNSCERRWLSFNFKKKLPIAICFLTINFFSNSENINCNLISLIKSLAHSNGGKFFNFILIDNDKGEGLFISILNYLWEIFNLNNEINKNGSKDFELLQPNDELISKFLNLINENLSVSVSDWQSSINKETVIDSNLIRTNLSLFLEFITILYASQKARNIFHKIPTILATN